MAVLADIIDWTTYRDEVLYYIGDTSPSTAAESMYSRWWTYCVETADDILARDDYTDPPPSYVIVALLDAMKAGSEAHNREQDVASFTVGQVAAQIRAPQVGGKPLGVMQRTLLVMLRPYRAGSVQLT